MEPEGIEDDIDGSIVSIHVRNFFCHDNLEVNLNRNINFIVGRNGSGKSAILTALVVGLGSRASATNRGSNLHSFIKKGANSASIEIKIKNSSERAYKHNVYGDFITIVRNINASGGSSYKVKSASGDVISTKFEEVNSIILAHDIQVDNPISVLNQDDARSFHASDAKKKYALFRKATNLDLTETNYARALDNCNKAHAICARKKDACVELEKEYRKWKTSHEQLQSRDEIESLKQSLQNEYYWSEIAELERDAAAIQAEYDKQKTMMDKLADKLSKMEQNYGSNTEAIDALKSKLDDMGLQKTALSQELQDVEGEMNSVMGTLRSTQHNTGKYTETLNREKRKIADLEREIENIATGSTASKRAALEARSRGAAEAAAAARARYDTAQHGAAQARANAAHAQAQADRAAAAAQRQRDGLKNLKQQLRELESRGNDSLAVYGNNMVELCQRIKQAVDKGQFSAPPRGPIGSYLKVKEKKWGGALEHILGGAVQAFCVNSADDSRKLFQIMGQVYGKSPKPAVTCSKFLNKKHDVRRSRVRAGSFASALDSLDVADPVVANYLVDNVGMERVLLVPDHEDAVGLADNEASVPANCSKIVTLDSTEYHPAPSYRSYGGAALHSRFLHLSTAERKKQVLVEIEEMETSLRSLEAQAEELSQEAKQARSAERDASRALQALLAERHHKDEAARAAAAALDQQQAPQHAVLVDELNISKERVESLEKQVDELKAKEQQCRQKVDEHEANMKKVKTALGKVTAACRSLSEEIDQEQLKMEQGMTKRKTCEQRLREDSSKMSQVEAILDDKRGVINKKIAEALTLCPRVENPRDMAIVTNELKKTQLKLSSIRSDGLSKAQVAEKLLEVQRKYLSTKQSLEKLKHVIDDIKNTTDKHLKICRTVQTAIARSVQHCFQSILTVRGYSGRMDIDHARGALEVTCSGREAGGGRGAVAGGGRGGAAAGAGAEGGRRAASTSSLSGGERSYATVAFIMALWECVELPFCFMDEFDVFMDNVNRKIVMKLLIDHALKNTSRQFVFLTPQDTSSVKAGPQIKIHLMAAPRP